MSQIACLVRHQRVKSHRKILSQSRRGRVVSWSCTSKKKKKKVINSRRRQPAPDCPDTVAAGPSRSQPGCARTWPSRRTVSVRSVCAAVLSTATHSQQHFTSHRSKENSHPCRRPWPATNLSHRNSLRVARLRSRRRRRRLPRNQRSVVSDLGRSWRR